jgi:hypothetical protein
MLNSSSVARLFSDPLRLEDGLATSDHSIANTRSSLKNSRSSACDITKKSWICEHCLQTLRCKTYPSQAYHIAHFESGVVLGSVLSSNQRRAETDHLSLSESIEKLEISIRLASHAFPDHTWRCAHSGCKQDWADAKVQTWYERSTSGWSYCDLSYA